MSFLENAKQYTGANLDTIFFRPMLSGDSAKDLGVRILYNMPVPTTVQLWDGNRNILQKYTAAGWSGGSAATKLQKTIDLGRVKAELGFSAADYFSLVYEQISASAPANMEDLTGTQLEEAETALFKEALAESIRATMWMGDAGASSGFNTFDGFLKILNQCVAGNKMFNEQFDQGDLNDYESTTQIFDGLFIKGDSRLQGLKAEGNLAYFVTSDIYFAYEKYLDSKGANAAYVDETEGRKTLMYHGIPVIDVRLGSYLKGSQYPESFVLLTDRRNLVLAVNTADFPGNEIRMWYNPDLMENRQRAVFMAGCDVLDETLMSYAYCI